MKFQARLLTAFGLSLFLCALAPAFAADPPVAHPVDSQAASLNLTAAQQQKLTALESVSRAQSDQLIGQIGQTREKLSDLYRAYDFNVNDARKMNQYLNRVQSQLLDLRLSEQLQLRKILSPDQFAQLQATAQKHGFSDEHRRHGPDSRPGTPSAKRSSTT